MLLFDDTEVRCGLEYRSQSLQRSSACLGIVLFPTIPCLSHPVVEVYINVYASAWVVVPLVVMVTILAHRNYPDHKIVSMQ